MSSRVFWPEQTRNDTRRRHFRMGLGEISALLAAVLWATGSLLYGKVRLSPLGMNFGKNLLATAVLLLQLHVEAAVLQRPAFQADLQAWWWLGCSGFAGIVIGDTLYFRSLQILGPRRALMMSTLAPLFAAGLSWCFLQELPGPGGLLGMLLTVGGVVCVVLDRGSAADAPGLFPGSLSSGLALGLGGAICTAIGAVTSRAGLHSCQPLEAAFIRIAVSGLAVVVLVAVTGRLTETVSSLRDRSVLTHFVPAVLCGTWLGIWLSQIAYKHTSVAAAITLTSTTPLFVMPLVRWLYGHRITPLGFGGAVVAIAGIYLTVAG